MTITIIDKKVYLMCSLNHPNIVKLYGICIPNHEGVIGERRKKQNEGVLIDQTKLGVVMEV